MLESVSSIGKLSLLMLTMIAWPSSIACYDIHIFLQHIKKEVTMTLLLKINIVHVEIEREVQVWHYYTTSFSNTYKSKTSVENLNMII
jgi:hypothetical protein